MKTKNIIIVSAAILLVVGGVMAARAHSRSMGIGFHDGHGFERAMATLAWKLDLTDAQRAQIKTMCKSEWPTVQPLVQQLVTEQDQMIEVTKNGTFDEARVKQIADRQSQAVGQLLVEKERFISRVYNEVLNPEQRTKADAMRQELEQRINRHLQEQPSARSNNSK